MAAREAEQTVGDGENEDLLEDQAPGDSANSMLIVSNSFDNLLVNDIEEEDSIALHKSQISDIVRHVSQEREDDSSSVENIEVNHKDINHAGDISTGEDSGEQSDVSSWDIKNGIWVGSGESVKSIVRINPSLL